MADEVQQFLLERFLASAVRDGRGPTVLTGTSFESRYYSSFLKVTIAGRMGTERFLAKLPKVEMRRGLTRIPPRLPEDLALAQAEFHALLELGRTWPGKHSAFVEPVFYDDELGAFVLPEIRGGDLVEWIRTQPERNYAELLEQLGHDLALYHEMTGCREPFDATPLWDRMLVLAQSLQSVVGGSTVAQVEARARADHGNAPGEALVVPGIKGFEVRNVLVGRDHRLWLVDPGKLKREPAEADVARFVVSCRMAWWGTARFPLAQGSRGAELAFLRSYRAHHLPNAALLSTLLMRETLKNWRSAWGAVTLKRLPTMVRRALVRWYVNPGFGRILSMNYR